jgi:HAD superfamily hydrolase (TIGR01509 family)
LQVVVCGDEVENGKPAHDVFTEAGKGLKVDPSKILVIEDAPSGIQVPLSCITLNNSLHRGTL